MIELQDLQICYGSVEVVPRLNLTINQGEFFTLLGPSGCGKTTVLRAIAGFVPAASGRILINGKDETKSSAEARDVGIVFQNYALFAHMSVFENVAFGLRVARKRNSEIKTAVDRMLEATGILEHRDKKPDALSGGQQQRVAIARSLVMGTQVLLFDEPLSNLDAKVRETMRHEIKRLQRELGFTSVFVTHDQEEALSMSDRLLVLNGGKVEQIGTARELYSSPQTPFVCQFIGASNQLGEKTQDLLGLQNSARAFIRPEHVTIQDPGTSGGIPATILDIDYVGPTTKVTLSVKGENITSLALSSDIREGLRVGAQVAIQCDRDQIMRFGTAK